jgi:thiol-disulfide isomerase/thioredoxin
MRKLLLSLALLLMVFSVLAQKQMPTPTANSVVIDSSGMKYPAMLWQKMLATNDYWLKPINPANNDTPFLLLKYTEEQKQYWYERMPKPDESPFFKTGEAIKPFKFKDITGKKIEPKDWIGKTLVFNFWFIGCPPCRAEIPELTRIAQKYKNNPNVIFVGFALDEAYDIKEFIKKLPFGYNLVSESQDYAHQFNINMYPTNVVIGKDGKVRLHYVSAPFNGGYWIDKTIQESLKEI